MQAVFIGGSLSIRQLAVEAQERIERIAQQNLYVLVGDAAGADRAVQKVLLDRAYRRVTVFCAGGSPRHNLGNWPTVNVNTGLRPGSRAYFTAKDVAMTSNADAGFMIWDGKSTGTLGNVVRLLEESKFTRVFVHPRGDFVAVKGVDTLAELVAIMSVADRENANAKIGLQARMTMLRSRGDTG